MKSPLTTNQMRKHLYNRPLPSLPHSLPSILGQSVTPANIFRIAMSFFLVSFHDPNIITNFIFVPLFACPSLDFIFCLSSYFLSIMHNIVYYLYMHTAFLL